MPADIEFVFALPLKGDIQSQVSQPKLDIRGSGGAMKMFILSVAPRHKLPPNIFFLASPAARSSAQIETETPPGRFLKVIILHSGSYTENMSHINNMILYSIYNSIYLLV